MNIDSTPWLHKNSVAVIKLLRYKKSNFLGSHQIEHLRQLFFLRLGLIHRRKEKSLVFEAKRVQREGGLAKPSFLAHIGNVGNSIKRRLVKINPVQVFLFWYDYKAFLCLERTQGEKAVFPHFVFLVSKNV